MALQGNRHPGQVADDRRSRRGRRRGVSPIIATILLVAITVVLAAVLYVLVAGLVHGPTSKPSIENAFEVGNPASGTCWTQGVTNHICGKAGNRLFNFSIAVSASVTLGDVLFTVKTPLGSTYVNPNAAAFAIMKAGLSTPIAYYTFAASAGLAMTKAFTYATGYSGTTEISSTMYVVIGTGTAASSWMWGEQNTVVVYGMNHFTGQTIGQTLP